MPEAQMHFVVATLWEYLEPIDRGERYEDPLNEQLARHNMGGVCGGGTQLSDECGIEYADIEIELADLEQGLRGVQKILEVLGAPKGSVLSYDEGGEKRTIEFGVKECVAIFLDGVGLPQEVYEQSDVDEIIDRIAEALDVDSLGKPRSFWSGPKETALFLYGDDAEKMFSALEELLLKVPLCQNARVVIRHGNPSLNPRTIRLPMHE